MHPYHASKDRALSRFLSWPVAAGVFLNNSDSTVVDITTTYVRSEYSTVLRSSLHGRALQFILVM